MRIQCDHCETRYSIAADKPRAPLCKVRCKRCGHTILVRTAPDPVSDDGSGLIDIRAMARATLATHRPAGAPVAEPVPQFVASMPAPLLMPAPQRMPVWAWAVVVMCVLALSGTVFAVLVHRPPPRVGSAPPAPPPAPRRALPASTALATALVAPQPDRPVLPEAPERRSRPARARAPSARAEPRTSAPAVPQPVAHTLGPPRDALSVLLDQASPERPPPSTPPPNHEPPVVEQLSRSEIAAGLRQVQPEIRSCFQRFAKSGAAPIDLVIRGDGKIATATARGAVAGTPVGACLEQAARQAGFPRFSGAAMSITYAFLPH